MAKADRGKHRAWIIAPRRPQGSRSSHRTLLEKGLGLGRDCRPWALPHGKRAATHDFRAGQRVSHREARLKPRHHNPAILRRLEFVYRYTLQVANHNEQSL
jgi:hypothetical protein